MCSKAAFYRNSVCESLHLDPLFCPITLLKYIKIIQSTSHSDVLMKWISLALQINVSTHFLIFAVYNFRIILQPTASMQ